MAAPVTQNAPSPATGTSAGSSQQVTQTSGKSNKALLYVAAGIVVIVLIGLVLLVLSGTGGTSSTTTVLPQSSTPAIYMSVAQAQSILGSPIVNVSYNYTATSLYNYTNPENMSVLETFVPQVAGNATNGWVTLAYGPANNNETIQYYVIQTANASMISALFAAAFSSTFPTLPNTVTGQVDGMNYTYESYTNSTGSVQALAGSKGGYVVLVWLQADSSFSNQTQVAQVAAENLP